MQAILFIILMVALNTFSLTKKESLSASEWSIYDYEAIVAYAGDSVSNPVPTPKPTDCNCKGTKRINTGDGRSFPCPCDNCTCPKEQGSPRQDEVPKAYLITATWCGPCHTFISNEVPKLKNMGYTVSNSESSNITILDYDKDARCQNWTQSLPAFVVIYKGKIIRSTFPGSANDVDKCYEGK